MAELNSFLGSVTGASGSVNALEAKSGWFVYVCERGAHAAAASTGTLITFDVAAEASRFDANDWVQVGTNTAKIVQVSAVGGNSISVGAAVTVFENDRIFNLGTTQPTVANGNATYSPNASIYERSDDASDKVSNSKLTTDSNGGYQVFAADGFYDAIIQDANTSNQGSIVDLSVGPATTGHLLPATNNTYDLGSSTRNWKDIYVAGSFISGVSDASGDTVFDFRNATGLTQGNLFEMSMNDVTLISGDTHGGIHDSWTVGNVFNVKSARFGAKGDNSTDDTAAIAAAITAANASDGGSTGANVYLPKGKYKITSQLVLPNHVGLRGDGSRSTYIIADSTFPADSGVNSAMIRIGDGGGSNAHSCMIEDLLIDCANISGSIGVYSTEANEESGIRQCLIVGYESAGAFFDGPQNQNVRIMNSSFGHNNTTATGISFNTVSSKNIIVDVTVNSDDAITQSSNAAIGITNSQVSVHGCHIEQHDTGIYYGVGSSGVASHIEGHSTVDNLVRTDQEGVVCFNLVASGSTNVVADHANGVTLTTPGSNAGGWYMSSNDAPIGGTRSIWTSSTDGTNQVNPNTVFGGTVSFSGRVVNTTALEAGPAWETVASANTITVSTNRVKLTGSTTIKTINPTGAAVDGTAIHLKNSDAGNITIDNTGNVQPRFNTSSFVLEASGGSVWLVYDNATSKWEQATGRVTVIT